MTTIIFYLLVGVAIGILELIPAKLQIMINRLSTVCLLIMLTALGAKLGAEPNILDRIGLMGLKALIIAAAAIVGAVIFAFCWQRIVQKLESNNEQTTKLPL